MLLFLTIAKEQVMKEFRSKNFLRGFDLLSTILIYIDNDSSLSLLCLAINETHFQGHVQANL